MKAQLIKVQFTCPECGSEQDATPVPVDFSKADPPAEPGKVRRDYLCANCGFEVPVHLAECWGGISLAEARKEWREIYRGLSPHNSTRPPSRSGAGRGSKAMNPPLSTTRTLTCKP